MQLIVLGRHRLVACSNYLMGVAGYNTSNVGSAIYLARHTITYF